MNIILTGSVAYDYLMTFPGYFREHILPDRLEAISLSFLVESMTRMQGGIAPNIAYTLALLGGCPHLFATVGEDFGDYREWLESKGVDTSGARVVSGEYTASFFANTDLSNAQIASFYPGAMAHAAELSMHDLSGKDVDLVVISPNDPAAMNKYVVECQELGIPYVYDPSQQIVRLTAEDLRRGVEGALALFVNDYESALIEKVTGLTPAGILDLAQAAAGNNSLRPFVVITRGEQGATVYTQDGIVNVPIVPPEKIVDPTGVGDAFRGGFLTGYGYDLDWTTCAQMGVLAATYCLEHRGTQKHSYSRDEFVARYRKHFDDRGQLDVLSNCK